MENSVGEENLKIEEKNKDYIPNSNLNNLNHSNNNQSEQFNSNNQLKLGQFMLTPLEVLILNKKMPSGYKFESEENILKTLELSKNQSKRIKNSERYGIRQRHLKIEKNQIKEDNNNNLNKDNLINHNKKIKKIVPKENSLNNNINNNTELYKIMMKCYKGFNKIKSNPNSNLFYLSKIPDSPSLSLIEKKIKNYEYKTVNDFCDDLRKLWNFQFKNYAKAPTMYQNICKMSLLSEQICKELSNDNNIKENKNEDIINIKKRTDKLKKDINEFKVNNQNNNNNQNDSNKKIIKQKEIYHLGELIRTLNKPQLKGIVAILSDNNENINTKTFEFDLEQLSYEKYKKLDEYVHRCKNQNKNHNNNHKNLNSNVKQNQNNIKNENKNIKNNNELMPKDKINSNNKYNINNINNNNTMIKNNNIKEEKNSNNETARKKEEKKINSEIKSFSSDSISSDSSLSN